MRGSGIQLKLCGSNFGNNDTGTLDVSIRSYSAMIRNEKHIESLDMDGKREGYLKLGPHKKATSIGRGYEVMMHI